MWEAADLHHYHVMRMMIMMRRMVMLMNGNNFQIIETNPLLDSRFESGLGPDRAEPELRDPDPATFLESPDALEVMLVTD